MANRRKERVSKKHKHFYVLLALLIYLPICFHFLHFTLSTDITNTSDDNPALSLERAQHRYLLYDEASIQPIPGTERIHRLPNAIPSCRTIPPEFVENKTYHLAQRQNTSTKSIKEKLYNWDHDYSKDFRTLYVYNPSIIPILPSSESNPDTLSVEDLKLLTGGDSSVTYVVIYRAYLGNNCFGIDPHRIMMDAGEQVGYLVMALLDENLNVIQDTDTLIDINAGPATGRYKYFRQFNEDCRIFLSRRSLYLGCKEFLHRIQIIRRQYAILNTSEYGTRDDHRMPYIYSNIYGDGLQLILKKSHNKFGGGKNFNIFKTLSNRSASDPTSTGVYDYYVQLKPSPHQYRRLNLPAPTETDLNLYPRGWESDFTSNSSLPRKSFDTIDDLFPIQRCMDNTMNCSTPKNISFWPQDEEHGTACCVSLNLNGQNVLVGISHHKLSTRTKFWMWDIHQRYDHFQRDQFVSRFVAYQSTAPFDIVARSGHFCLGYGHIKSANNSLAGFNSHIHLDLFNHTYDCPPIHFASTFSEFVGDSSKAILGYGVNDCYPRLMVVSKHDIVKILNGQL